MQGAEHPRSPQNALESPWSYGWGRRCSSGCRLGGEGCPRAETQGFLQDPDLHAGLWDRQGSGGGSAPARGLLPSGCPCASVELPGCVSLTLPSLGSSTDTNGSRQAGSSGKDQTLGARGCCQCKTRRSEPSQERQPQRSPCLVMPLRQSRVPTRLQRWQTAGRSLPGGFPGCLLPQPPWQGLAMARTMPWPFAHP